MTEKQRRLAPQTGRDAKWSGHAAGRELRPDARGTQRGFCQQALGKGKVSFWESFVSHQETHRLRPLGCASLRRARRRMPLVPLRRLRRRLLHQQCIRRLQTASRLSKEKFSSKQAAHLNTLHRSHDNWAVDRCVSTCQTRSAAGAASHLLHQHVSLSAVHVPGCRLPFACAAMFSTYLGTSRQQAWAMHWPPVKPSRENTMLIIT